MPRKRTIPLEEHFWAKVDRSQACWLWRDYCRPKGYGQYYIERSPQYAHRVAWELTYGPIPTGLCVCHACDTPPCVRPAHLFIGPPPANREDARRKGRLRVGNHTGEHQAAAKFTAEMVRRLRQQYADGRARASLAREYGVAYRTVHRIVARKAWSHVA